MVFFIKSDSFNFYAAHFKKEILFIFQISQLKKIKTNNLILVKPKSKLIYLIFIRGNIIFCITAVKKHPENANKSMIIIHAKISHGGYFSSDS